MHPPEAIWGGERVGCPQATNSESLYLSFVRIRVGNGEVGILGRQEICVAIDGRIGG